MACSRFSFFIVALVAFAGPAIAEVREEFRSSLLARFKDLSGEIVSHAKQLSLNDAVVLRHQMREISQAIEVHHTFHNATSHPTPPPQPSECGVLPDPFPGKSNMPLGHRQKIAAEQGVPLSYFEAGYYGNVSSGDPRVFGPDAWRTLHRFSVHYPKSPTPQTRGACEMFLRGLPYMIPCPHCGYHLQEFMVLNEKHAGEVREECLGNCTGVTSICGSQAIMVGFFARAHNNVNIHNYKWRPNFTTADVYAAYLHGSVAMGPYGPGPTPWTTQGPIDGKCQLIRSVDGHNCSGPPDFCKSGAAQDVLRNLELCQQASFEEAAAREGEVGLTVSV